MQLFFQAPLLGVEQHTAANNSFIELLQNLSCILLTSREYKIMFASQLACALALGSRKYVLYQLPIKVLDSMPSLRTVVKVEEPPGSFVADSNDQGYFIIDDPYRCRLIYVCTEDVGKDASFLAEMDIKSTLDVSKEPEEHYDHQTDAKRIRVLHGLIHCLKLLLDSTGDVLIHCRNGRTRSPAFVAAYFMIVSCLSQEDAYSFVSAELLAQRPAENDQGMDRLGRFVGNMKDLCCLVDTPPPGGSKIGGAEAGTTKSI